MPKIDSCSAMYEVLSAVDSAVSVIQRVSAGGYDVAFVFRWVFLAAFGFMALSLLFLVLMEERPLRSSVLPADPPVAPPPAQ